MVLEDLPPDLSLYTGRSKLALLFDLACRGIEKVADILIDVDYASYLEKTKMLLYGISKLLNDLVNKAISAIFFRDSQSFVVDKSKTLPVLDIPIVTEY